VLRIVDATACHVSLARRLSQHPNRPGRTTDHDLRDSYRPKCIMRGSGPKWRDQESPWRSVGSEAVPPPAHQLAPVYVRRRDATNSKPPPNSGEVTPSC